MGWAGKGDNQIERTLFKNVRKILDTTDNEIDKKLNIRPICEFYKLNLSKNMLKVA